MIKLIIIVLILSSCSVISYGQLPGLIKDSLMGIDIIVDDEFYKAQNYSFAKIKIGRSLVAIAVLASANNEKYLWVSQDGVRIYTNNGRITETIGLQYDVRLLEGNKDIKKSLFINYNSEEIIQTKRFAPSFLILMPLFLKNLSLLRKVLIASISIPCFMKRHLTLES